MAKGNVYRYFDSKEELLTAAIESLLADTTSPVSSRRWTRSGGVAGLHDDPEKAAMVFGYLVAGVLPMLLELGARAAKGHEPSADLARKVLRTLAETAGRPSVAPDADRDGHRAGLRVIETAFCHRPVVVGRDRLAARITLRRTWRRVASTRTAPIAYI